MPDPVDTFADLYTDEYRRAVRSIVDLVYNARANGASPEQLANLVNTLSTGSNTQQALLDLGYKDFVESSAQYYRAAASEVLDVTQALAGESLQAAYLADQQVLFDAAVNGGRLAAQESLVGTLARRPESEIVKNILSGAKGNLAPYQARALANTAINTSVRATTAIVTADLPADQKYISIGPVSGARPICLAVIAAGPMTKAEFERDFPGYFVTGGGYNCRHRVKVHLGESAKKREKAATEGLSASGETNPQTPVQIHAET